MPGIRLNGDRLSLKHDTLESDSSPLPIILCYLSSPKRSHFYKHCLSIVTKTNRRTFSDVNPFNNLNDHIPEIIRQLLHRKTDLTKHQLQTIDLLFTHKQHYRELKNKQTKNLSLSKQCLQCFLKNFNRSF